jgi:hypothetical protein
MTMRATVGDRLVVKGRKVGDAEHDAEILEVRGRDGGPPFLVRWSQNERVALFYPGPDTFVEHPGGGTPQT